MKENPLLLTKSEGIDSLLELIESLVDDPERKNDIKKNLMSAFDERKEVIAKYVLREISVYSNGNYTEEQAARISLLSYNFV